MESDDEAVGHDGGMSARDCVDSDIGDRSVTVGVGGGHAGVCCHDVDDYCVRSHCYRWMDWKLHDCGVVHVDRNGCG